MPASGNEDRAQALRRVGRELRRLEARAGKRRLRVRAMRGLRGGLGATATFGLLLKLKLAGSGVLKIALAALVGLGFAWPTLALLVFALLGLLWAIVSLFDGSGGPHPFDGDGPRDCARRETRAKRLGDLIAQRRAWLDAPSGPAPSLRRDGSRGPARLLGL